MAEKKGNISKSETLGARLIYAALKILKENDGELPGKEVVKKVGERIQFSDWDQERYEKTNYVRWQSMLSFFTIDLVKAGYLIKKKGIWYLTKEGEEALKLGEVELLKSARKKYREWRETHPKTDSIEEEISEQEIERKTQELTLDDIEQLAIDSIKQQINSKNPYEFQELAAALLRAMGYYTPFVSPKGKDGGIDIIAYRDPLGTATPRIKVQVKHKETTVTSVKEVRQLMGILQKDGDVGIFISTGGFTPDAKNTARDSHIHVELIDLDRFILLWQEFYNKLVDEDKALLPLLPFYFYAPSE